MVYTWFWEQVSSFTFCTFFRLDIFVLSGMGGGAGNMVFVVLSTLYFAKVGAFIHLTNRMPAIRGIFFHGFITVVFTFTTVLGSRRDFGPGGNDVGCLVVHSTLNLTNIFNGFCTLSEVRLTSTSVLGGVDPFFILVFSTVFVGRGIGPGRTITINITFINTLFVVGPAFDGPSVLTALTNFNNKVNTKTTCAYIHGLNLRNRGNGLVILFFSTFSYTMALPCLVFGCRCVDTRR